MFVELSSYVCKVGGPESSDKEKSEKITEQQRVVKTCTIEIENKALWFNKQQAYI